MDHRRRLFHMVSIIVALACVVRLISPALSNPATASAAPSSPITAAASHAAAAVPISSFGPSTLQVALNLLVRQAVTTNGWGVSALTSRLTPSDENVSGLSGTGEWQVQALDEKQQPLSLQGTLSYQVAAPSAASAASSASIILSGTLQAASVALALDLKSQAQSNGVQAHSTSHIGLKQARAGQVQTTTMDGTNDTRTPAYNLTQAVTRSAVDRDGKTANSTQTVTTRNLGRGESEVWLQVDSALGSALTTVTQHVFQRVNGNRLSQFLDRYDLNKADNRFSLKAPVSLDGTLDGNARYNLTLVDQNGKTIQVSSPVGPSSSLAPHRVNGMAAPLPPDHFADVPQLPPFLPAAGCGSAAQGVIGAAAVVALVALIALMLGAGLPIAALGGAVLASEAAFFEALVLAAIAAMGGAFGTGAANCANADPYFISPDSRANADAVNPTPIQITRVTGGLVAAPPVAATSASAIPTANESAQVEYRDRPEVFVGGALPHGATAIGDWAWDANRTFGGAPSHTQPRSAGTQQQYFIHATQPISAGADDNIIQYVYLDPQNPPSEIYVQFYVGNGDGEHRAYWGADRVQTGGHGGTSSLYPMGALPDKGGWVRLKIPAGQLGVMGQPIHGILFGAFGGQTWWGTTTTASRLTDTAPDQWAVTDSPAPVATQPGAQIAFRLTQTTTLTVQVVDASGTPVHALMQNEARQPGYQVVVWDAKNDSGALVPDQPYRVRISSGGQTLAEAPLTISPFVADIASLRAFSVVRGVDVPIFGEAYGTNFISYTVEYGDGVNPATWNKIVESLAPRTLPNGAALSHINAGNLANWNVGIDEFRPWQQPGLNGVYTLRLRIRGSDGREASDTFPVVVGRLASFPEGGTIKSADGKARLVVPPLATKNPFALMALVPLALLEPDGNWKRNLPSDKALAGDVYEVFLPDETFRQPAVLELPIAPGGPADKLGVLLGDGTPGGWHYLGGKVDAQKQIITVPISAFGNGRALVAAFSSDHFGTPSPFGASAPPLAFDSRSAAPAVTAASAPFAFYSDLASSAGEWTALDTGTQLTLVKGAAAGLANDAAALKVTRLSGGVRLVQVRATPYDAAKFPILSFDYRLPPGSSPNLLVRSNGVWWQFQLGGDSATHALSGYYFQPVSAPHWQADDTWHHYQLDLLGALRANQPDETKFQVDAIALGQVEAIAYLQYVPFEDGAVGASYFIRNFAALAPTNATALSFTLAAPGGGNFGAYSFALDQHSDTLPPTTASSTSGQISAGLPGGAADGLWYLHVRGQGTDGQWSAPAHFSLLVDRQPPQIGKPDPAPGGAGAPDQIAVPLADAVSGVDASSLRMSVNGAPYGLGKGLRYEPTLHALLLTPSQLQPAPAPIANGQKVDLVLSNTKDYAGNEVSAPFAWSFTADRPIVSGDQFRLLTADGGESPALSADGTQVAFVSSRSGLEKIWVMRADDYEEKAKSARPLDTGSAHESDPDWSPAGSLIAFVSDADGSPQIWSAAPDGSGAHPLTQGSGGAASPTWSPDGKTVAFVRDGNLWQVNADSTDLHALTDYPERPLKAVRWQPDGQLLAVDFKLYQETIDVYNPATGQLSLLTEGGEERTAAWLNDGTLLYTAPAGQHQSDAVWQVNLDGSGAAIVAGSGQPGMADMQPAPARGGDALAITSTRNGALNVWLRANLQLALLEVSPAIGAVPGTPLQITYALPADARVTLEVVNAKKLLDSVQQTKGTQTISWDGTDANGKALPPGDYLVRLSAQIGASPQPLERFATARILEASTLGVLQLAVNQWTNLPLSQAGDLHIQAYPQGERVHAAAQADATASPSFKLPAGPYDLFVTYHHLRREFDGVAVEAGKSQTQSIDLGLGALQVTLLLAAGHPVSGNALIQVSRSDDPTQVPSAVQYTGDSTFALPAGMYDVLAEYQGVRQSLTGVRVETGQTAKHEIDLGAGVFQLSVLAFAGQPARTGGKLLVQAFSPADHQTVIATDYNNPATLLLAAGTYDVRVTYYGGNTTLEQWLNGVAIQSGTTVSQTYDLHLGEVKLDVLEATGKPADPAKVNLFLYPHGDLTNSVGSAFALSSAPFQVPPGSYDVVVEYASTNLHRLGPVATVQVTAGQSIAQTINLKLGKIQIRVQDASGQLVDPSRIIVQAYPAGKREASFASAFETNPSELPVLADNAYDLVVSLDSKHVQVPAQAVKEGTTLTLTLNVNDFQ